MGDAFGRSVCCALLRPLAITKFWLGQALGGGDEDDSADAEILCCKVYNTYPRDGTGRRSINQDLASYYKMTH